MSVTPNCIKQCLFRVCLALTNSILREQLLTPSWGWLCTYVDMYIVPSVQHHPLHGLTGEERMPPYKLTGVNWGCSSRWVYCNQSRKSGRELIRHKRQRKTCNALSSAHYEEVDTSPDMFPSQATAIWLSYWDKQRTPNCHRGFSWTPSVLLTHLDLPSTHSSIHQDLVLSFASPHSHSSTLTP